MLSEYYDKDLYPFELIFRMMTCNKKLQSAESRVIAVQFQANVGVFVMHNYPRNTVQALKRKMLVGSSRPPESMHMAHFKDGKHFLRAQKELVFDMDITDFYRFCECRGVKRLCPVCWFHIQGASLLLQYLLEEVMGYERAHCLWVFSGGKGVHCFVNESRAMNLSDKERSQLHKRLSIVMGDDARLIAFITTLVKNAPQYVDSLNQFFLDVLREHDLFALPAFEERPGIEESFELFCLRHLRARHITLYYQVKDAWDKEELSPSPKKARLGIPETSVGGGENISVRKWKILQQLETLYQSAYRPSLFLSVSLMYPRIDPGPFNMVHQIKLPFSVHATTHNIALPLTQEMIMRMDIKRDVLTLEALCGYFKAHKTVPESFNERVQLLETWIEMY